MNSLNTNPMDSTLREYSGEAFQLKKWADKLIYLDSMTQEQFKKLLFKNASKDYLQAKWDLFCSNKLRFILSISHNFDLLERIVYYIAWFEEVNA